MDIYVYYIYIYESPIHMSYHLILTTLKNYPHFSRGKKNSHKLSTLYKFKVVADEGSQIQIDVCLTSETKF